MALHVFWQKGDWAVIPPCNPHTALPVEFGSESASRVLKGEVIFSLCSYGATCYPASQEKKCGRCSCSRKAPLIHSAHWEAPPQELLLCWLSSLCLPLATRQPFLLSSNEWRVLLCCFLLSSVFLAQLHQSPANWLTDLPNDCQAPFLVYSNHIIGMASPAGKQCKVTSLCLPRRGQESYNWGKNSMNILILGVLISFKFCLKPKHNLTLHTDSSNTHIHKHTHDERSYRAFWGCDPQIFFIWHTLDA